MAMKPANFKIQKNCIACRKRTLTVARTTLMIRRKITTWSFRKTKKPMAPKRSVYIVKRLSASPPVSP